VLALKTFLIGNLIGFVDQLGLGGNNLAKRRMREDVGEWLQSDKANQ